MTKKTLATFPHAVKLWDFDKNDSKPEGVSYGSAVKYWWKCNKGPDHQWESSPNLMTRKRKWGYTGCPFCNYSRVSVTNSLASLSPETAKSWHPTKNGKITPKDVMNASNKKFWWKCDKGPDHEWETTPSHRAEGNNCPYCAGKKASVTNSLASLYPKIAKEWHPEKNGKLTPETVVAGSHKAFWWKCPKGSDHEWKARRIRTGQDKIRGCPFCAGRKLSKTNSVATVLPDLVHQWHPTKNGDLTPMNAIASTHIKYWWKCNKGPDHEWKSTRVRGKIRRGCPCCSNPAKQLSVTNRFDVLHPELLKEWHPTRNKLKPERQFAGSQNKVWWKCSAGHEWKTAIVHRTSGNESGCPFCYIYPRSKQEIMLTFELMNFFDIDLDSHKIRIGTKIHDVDIKIPSHNLVIEFDGAYWHREKADVDLAKVKSLEKENWKTIRIREEPLKKLTENDIEVPVQNSKSRKETVNLILRKIEQVCNIKIDGLNDYLELNEPTNKKAAEDYIAKLIKEKNQTTLEI